MPNNYSRGKIYKIVCRKTGLQYFGSTTEPTLARRLACHVCAFKGWKENRHHFLTSFTILEENDYYIELVELVSCSSKDELLIRERFHIENNDCVNKYIPLRTNKEYCEYNKKYREINKEKIAEYRKEYLEINKEHISEYMKEYAKEYYKTNNEKINEKAKEKYDCPCGSTLRKSDKAQHNKSIKHQNYLKKELENAEKTLEKNIVIEYGKDL
jgi:hypothetical protein